jgi:hypothetical protein
VDDCDGGMEVMESFRGIDDCLGFRDRVGLADDVRGPSREAVLAGLEPLSGSSTM